MTTLEAIILGVIEGLTEFLPVSSTGHLILASNLLGITQTDFVKSFEIAIQLGAILAVVALTARQFFEWEVLKRLSVAFVPTGIVGFLLYKTVKTSFLGNESLVLWALLLGGIALIVFELLHREHESAVDAVLDISYTQAFFVGLFQSIAVIPGVSRSAATILGGLLLGVRRVAIVEFSFLLAVPTMLAATGLDILKSAHAFSWNDAEPLAAGFLTSFLVALFAIRFLLSWVKTHTFIPFGIYRILIALLFFAIVLV